jgi:hypothetical protein
LQAGLAAQYTGRAWRVKSMVKTRHSAGAQLGVPLGQGTAQTAQAPKVKRGIRHGLKMPESNAVGTNGHKGFGLDLQFVVQDAGFGATVEIKKRVAGQAQGRGRTADLRAVGNDQRRALERVAQAQFDVTRKTVLRRAQVQAQLERIAAALEHLEDLVAAAAGPAVHAVRAVVSRQQVLASVKHEASIGNAVGIAANEGTHGGHAGEHLLETVMAQDHVDRAAASIGHDELQDARAVVAHRQLDRLVAQHDELDGAAVDVAGKTRRIEPH